MQQFNITIKSIIIDIPDNEPCVRVVYKIEPDKRLYVRELDAGKTYSQKDIVTQLSKEYPNSKIEGHETWQRL